MMTFILCLLAIATLGWGFYRARPMGKLGLVAWLQSVVLMSPWLILFILIGIGLSPNWAVILALIVISIGIYIALGRWLRAIATQEGLIDRQSSGSSGGKPSLSAAPGTPQTASALNSESAPQDQPPESADSAQPFIPVPNEDLQRMKGIFGIDSFFATETIPYQDGVIFKGNLRGEVETTYARLNEALEEALGDRYRLFLVTDQEDRPVVIVLPSRNDPKPMSLFQQGFALLLAIATTVSCLASAAFLLGFDLFSSPERIKEALPIGLGLVGLLLIHEIGHQVLARRHGVRFSLPFFFPTLQIGSFGALNRFESLIPNRPVLFDVAFAGPAMSGLVSLLLVILGLFLSSPNPAIPEGSVLLSFPTPLFQGSILVGSLARVILGNGIQADLVAVHPLFVVGWLGLVINAINLMPAGQLDGGRVIQAIYGRRVAGRTTLFTLIFLALAALVNPLALYWAIIILFLQRELERPTQNDLLEVDDTRAALGLLALFLTVSVLIPLTPSLAGQLGIGR
ncbi:site-2 protease family protein [Lyngbya confervoides]|uniref:Site-2 protease family protein n=1 Tax=Lyngbya confervoides BDU141951 TaxID=1574623 RepID=A0ABD4TA80_9CYAN|nr:site-2 protease family protein [Lyngbya confervoides]MCM1985303.1 site-2 protease family protein [Lyngbya confervoides BDU141951]